MKRWKAPDCRIFIDGFTQLLVGLFLFIALLKGQARLSYYYAHPHGHWPQDLVSYSLRSSGSLSMDRRRLFLEKN